MVNPSELNDGIAHTGACWVRMVFESAVSTEIA